MATALARTITPPPALCCVTCSGTNRTFFLGNWEGDWALGTPNWTTGGFALFNPLGPAGMVAWLTARQNAVNAAKNDVKHFGVEVR
jgi:hypothetical protein